MNTVIALALIVGGSVLFQLLGMLWHGPLFEKTWMKAADLKSKDLKMSKDEARVVYGGSFAAGMVTSGLLYLAALGSQTWVVMTIAVLVTVVFAAAVALPAYLFEKRSLVLWGLHYGYVACSAVIVGIVINLFA